MWLDFSGRHNKAPRIRFGFAGKMSTPRSNACLPGLCLAIRESERNGDEISTDWSRKRLQNSWTFIASQTATAPFSRMEIGHLKTARLTLLSQSFQNTARIRLLEWRRSLTRRRPNSKATRHDAMWSEIATSPIPAIRPAAATLEPVPRVIRNKVKKVVCPLRLI